MRKFTLTVLVLLVSVFFLTQSTFSQSILVVDRDGSSWAPADFTDCWPWYMDALDANGYTYDYHEVMDGGDDGPDAATMMGYDIVIWFTGEVWSGGHTTTPNDELNLGTFLDAGGALFFSGQDYLWDRYPSAGSFSAGEFPYDYLGLRSASQDVWVIVDPDVLAVTGHGLAEGMSFEFHDIFTADKEGLYVDEITDHAGVDLFEVTAPSPGLCAVQYEIRSFKSVFTAADFAAITDAGAQADLMAAIVGYFTGGGGCEDFDALTVGVGVAEQLGGYWTTWSGGPTDDAMVTDAQSHSPDNSFVVDAGAVDLIRQFGADPLSTGQWLYSHYMYVPAGFSGYFNVQTEPTPGVGWNLELYFDDDGTGYFGGQASENFVYDMDTWFLVEIDYDLDRGYGQVLFDGELIIEFENDMTIGSIDYYGADSGGPPGAYYDDVCFGYGWIITGIEEFFMSNNLVVYPNPASDKITIESESIIDEVRIYNNMGQLVYSGQFNNSQIMVNTSSFITGMYIVQVVAGEAIEVRKLIIE